MSTFAKFLGVHIHHATPPRPQRRHTRLTSIACGLLLLVAILCLMGNR